MGITALWALFSALGQAPVAGAAVDAGEARRLALDAALRLCVEQAASAALGRPFLAEERILAEQVSFDVRSFVDSFRVLDEGEGGGVRFAFVEADVSLGRLARRLSPAAGAVSTRLAREVGEMAAVRGAGKSAVSVRLHGDVLLGDRPVARVDETAWGFGSSAQEALADADRRAQERVRASAQRLAGPSTPGTTALVWVAIRGLGAARALALCAALPGRAPGVRSARLLRAGAGSADAVLETTLSPEDLAKAIEAVEIGGLALLAEATPAGEIAARVVDR